MNTVRGEVRTMAAALAFFTRVPLPARIQLTADDLARAVTYFPICGWLVGGGSALVWWAAAQVFPPGIAAGLALAAGVLATGAMHEDGFADACDGFGGGNSRQRILEIMQDSRIGAFGAIGIVLALGLKWQALASLPAVYVPAALIACHSISRGMAATLMASLDYARREGPAKSRALAVRLGGVRLAFVVVTAVVPIVLLPLRAWWVLGALAIARWAAVRYFRNRIGGYTGDCLGAAQQVAELLCLLVFLGVG